MSSNRWLKKQSEDATADAATHTTNVSMGDVRPLQPKTDRADEHDQPPQNTPVGADSLPALHAEKELITGQPVNQTPENQLTTLVNQLTIEKEYEFSNEVVNQSTSQLVNQSPERCFKSRKNRRLKGIRFLSNNLKRYEVWCLLNNVEFQDAADFALIWLTSQPVNLSAGQLVTN